MNAKKMAVILPTLSLLLFMSLIASEIKVAHAATIVRVVPTVVQADSYSFKRFDVPGATYIYVASINDSGQVAGYYNDALGSHGFVYAGSNGTLTTFDVLGATNIYVASINDSGQVAGYYRDASGSHGFVYTSSDGTLTTLGSSEVTVHSVAGINNLGQVVGHCSDASGSHGCIYNSGDGTFTTFDAPPDPRDDEGGDDDSYAPSMTVTGINDSGQVTGDLFYRMDGFVSKGFVYKNGTFDIFSEGSRRTIPTSINNNGQVVGIYGGLDFIGFFVYGGSVLTAIEPPGGTFNSYSHSVNDSGQVVGEYQNASSSHGYVYGGDTFAILDVPDATYTMASDINNLGQVAGTYRDASGDHGFIATPAAGTPFSAFTIKRLAIDQNRGALFLWSKFTLGDTTNGIDPLKDAVTFKIGNAEIAIPPSSFRKNPYLPLYAFAGHIDSVWVEAAILSLGNHNFAFQALAYGATVGDASNPVTVMLTIGDDSGKAQTNPTIH